MKTALFYDTQSETNNNIELFIKTVSAFKDIKCDLSAFDVDARRANRPILATCANMKIQVTDIYSYDELANLGKEGYKLVSVNNLEEYAERLANTYKYC